jgi:hypothetical protein
MGTEMTSVSDETLKVQATRREEKMPTQAQVEAAEEQLLRVSSTREVWSPKALRSEARDGLPVELISLAFWRLLNRGALVLDDDRQIRRAGLDAA